MPLSITRLRAITGAVVIAAAVGSGYFMQKGQMATPVKTTADTVSVQAIPASGLVAAQGAIAPAELSVLTEPPVTRGLPQSILIIPTNAPSLPAPVAPENGAVMLAASVPTQPFDETGNPQGSGGAVNTCEVGFTATAAPGAMVDLTLEAPCYAGQQVDIFHAGARFSEMLDDAGIFEVSVPALEEDAFFSAKFADGRTEATDILMLTVDDYQRTALLWQGEAGFSLYALENGAKYGQPGMVSAEQPYDAKHAINGGGGFFTMLGAGKAGYRTAIYSWPVRLNNTGPAPEISVEAKVLDSTCAQQITASFLNITPGQAPESEPLFMAMPGCDAIGQYLVLKNLSQAVRIATN